jgi:choline-sulfatase
MTPATISRHSTEANLRRRPPLPGRGLPSTSARRQPLVLALFAASALWGCERCSPEQSLGTTQGGPGAGTSKQEPAAVSARTKLHGVRSLLQETPRAELDAGGLLIDFGSSDQHKYTLAGWNNGWAELKEDPDGTTYAEISTRSVPIRVFLPEELGPVRQLALRVRAPQDVRALSVLVDGKDVGSAELKEGWTVVRLSVAEDRIPPGRRALHLVFASTGKDARPAVDWLWLGRSSDPVETTVGPRVRPLTIGSRSRRALTAGDARTYSFYLEIPEATSLVFDYGAEGETRFVVRARADGEEMHVLFDQQTTPGRWQEAVVDLRRLAGKAVRLELATEGPASPAGWADPELMLPVEGARPGRPQDQKQDQKQDQERKPAKNLLVLVIDTVRADVYTPFNPQTQVKAPAFDALAAESTVFVNAYANENWTKPSVATILSGLYPATHGAKRDNDVLSSEVKLLSEHLQQQQFATAAFIANGYVSDKFGFQRGWDHYTNYIRENKPSEAERVFKDAQDWVEKARDRRFFLYIQTIDPHVPYAVPAEYVRLYHPEPYTGPVGPSLDGHEQAAISAGKKKASDADRRWIQALYHGEVTYHDTYMGKFFEALRELGVLDDTLVIVTNDHGEELGEHGRLGHGHSLYEELVRAPLVMRYPARFAPGRRVLDVAENVDIFPTATEVLGLAPVPDLDGLSMVPLIEGRPAGVPSYAIAEFLDNYRAVRVGAWKLIAAGNGDGRLFDVETDPGETRDRAADAPIARRMCEIHLSEALATPAKAARFRDARAVQRRFKPGVVKQDPELRRQLEALGYFGATK